MQAIASGIVHTFVMTYSVTNTLHDSSLHSMLWRMMTMWALNSDLNGSPQTSHQPHVPDILTASGLQDFMALGNLVECAQVLDRRSYTATGVHWQDQIEMATARWRYRRLLGFLAVEYVAIVNGKRMSPITVFRQSLVEFAAAIVVYKEDTRDVCPPTPGCTVETVFQKMNDLFKANYPELLPCFHQFIADRVEFFYWTGPHVIIRPRTKTERSSRWQEEVDFHDKNIYWPVALPKEKAAMGDGLGKNRNMGTGTSINRNAPDDPIVVQGKRPRSRSAGRQFVCLNGNCI